MHPGTHWKQYASQAERLSFLGHRHWACGVTCAGSVVWRFVDVKRQPSLDYIDQRLDAGYAVAQRQDELRAFHAFLVPGRTGLWGAGFAAAYPGLKPPDTLPKFLTDEQVRKLQEDFEGRVSQAEASNRRRDALLDRRPSYLLWQGGLRIGEVDELRLVDLDDPYRKLAVRNSKGCGRPYGVPDR